MKRIGFNIKEHKIKQIKIKDIITDGDNPNEMSLEQEQALSESMEKFGYLAPIIIDENNVVADGEHRLKVYESFGVETIPAYVIKFKDEGERKLFRQVANKLKGVHNEKLDAKEYLKIIEAGYKEELQELLGQSDKDIKEILKALREEKEEEYDSSTELDKITKPTGKIGDLWILGKHRLMCGDSTSKDDVNKLLNKETPTIMVTDPPYGVDYNPSWRDEADKKGVLGNKYPTRSLGKVLNDKRVDWSDAYKLFPGDIAYVYHAGVYSAEVYYSIINSGFEMISQIIWVKPHFALSRGDYHWKHEPLWYAVRKGKKHNWQGSRKEHTVWEIAGMNAMGASHDKADEATGHGTQKPLECMERPIRNNTEIGQGVYDPFGGSGTTLIASEKLDRVCYMMELDPKYCDVIISRWEKYTGEKAIKL